MEINLTKRHGWRNPTASLCVAVIAAAALTTAAATSSAAGSNEPRPTIVLVHGAFADASGWNDVTRRLQRDDYTVIATANPLRSVDSDAAYLESILDTITDPSSSSATPTAASS
jgi:pimeloyl-ACP methyl ester carboxylesterase